MPTKKPIYVVVEVVDTFETKAAAAAAAKAGKKERVVLPAGFVAR